MIDIQLGHVAEQFVFFRINVVAKKYKRLLFTGKKKNHRSEFQREGNEVFFFSPRFLLGDYSQLWPSLSLGGMMILNLLTNIENTSAVV